MKPFSAFLALDGTLFANAADANRHELGTLPARLTTLIAATLDDAQLRAALPELDRYLDAIVHVALLEKAYDIAQILAAWHDAKEWDL
jgi:hypothetical protein